jgi:GNAT superfamily N-acetyltransferase
MYSVKRDNWKAFMQYHYMSAKLHRASQAYGLVYNNIMVGFAAILPLRGFKGRRRVHRIVIQPDYQGAGFGTAFLNMLGQYYQKQEIRLSISSSHPAIIRGLERNQAWRCSSVNKDGSPPHSANLQGRKGKRVGGKRSFMASFEYKREKNLLDKPK